MSDPNKETAHEAKEAFKILCGKKKKTKAFLFAQSNYLDQVNFFLLRNHKKIKEEN